LNATDAYLRLRIAEGFLAECREDVALGRWRSAVDNAQMAVEHSAKAVMALVGPVARTHNPAAVLRELLASQRFPGSVVHLVERVAACAERLGFDVHIRTDYGDEEGGRTPWELFGEVEARQALEVAVEAVTAASAAVQATAP
jgi:HEPN domain-containing protein